jgi:hypothetical protein
MLSSALGEERFFAAELRNRRGKMKKILCALGVCVMGASLAQADVMAQYTFEGNSAASSDSSIYSSATTDWDISHSAAATLITNGLSQVHANQAATPAGISATTVDASNAGAQWQQFSFTVANLGAGETLSLTSFSYTYTVVQPLNFQSGVYSSLSGYTGLSNMLGGTENTSTAQTFTPNIDLTGNSVFSGLTNGQTVEFRIYLKDGSTNVSTRYHQLDNIVLNGTVIPEPASIGMLGLGALITLLIRRWRS